MKQTESIEVSDVKKLLRMLNSLENGEVFQIQIIKRNNNCKVDNEVIEKRTKSLERRIYKFLLRIGIPSNIKVYNYIKTAIILAYYDPSILDSITKVLYPEIAREYNTTPSRAERAIRHAIEVACTRGNVEVLSEVFEYSISASKGKPTNSEFIAQVVNAMQMDLI